MSPAVVVAIVLGVALVVVVGVSAYLKAGRQQAALREQQLDRKHARSASAAEWATKVEVPDWADRGSAEVNKRNLPDGTSIGSSSGSFSFDNTRKGNSASNERADTNQR